MKIDVHTHFVAISYVEQARQGQATGGVTVLHHEDQEWVVHPEGFRYPLHRTYWDMEAKLQEMDSLGIDLSLLSPTPTLFQYGLPAGAALEFCQQANEALASVVSESGGRLQGMAVVPMQDPSAAAAELRRAVRELGLKAANIGTTVDRVPVDDARFEPFFAAAEELGIPVVLHPFAVDARREQFAQYYMGNLVGYMVETCVAAARLILSGCLDRHPSLSVALVHAGGFLPYQIGRLDHGFQVRSETHSNIEQPPSSYLRRFYFDTITHAPIPLGFLIDLVGSDRVMLGTDLPFDMADRRFAETISALELGDEAVASVYAGTAIRLFGLDEAEGQ